MKYKDTKTGEILKVKVIKNDENDVSISFIDKKGEESRLDGPSEINIDSSGETGYYSYNIGSGFDRVDGPVSASPNHPSNPFCIFAVGGVGLGKYFYTTRKFERDIRLK